MTVLRIAVVNPPLDYSGGMGRVLQRDLTDLADSAAVELTYFDSRGPGGKVGSLLQACRTAAALRRRIRAGQIDIAHVNFSVRLSSVRKLLIAAVARHAGAATVVHFHAGEFPAFYQRLPRIAQFLLLRQLTACTAIMTLADVWTRYLAGIGIPRDQLLEVPNGSSGPLKLAPRQLRCPLRLLYAGRITYDKGAGDLTTILAALHARGIDAHLTIAGDGPATAVLEEQIAAAQLGSHVTLVGWVEPAQLAEILAQTDIFLLPSYYENQPSSILEAMSYGVPSVASAVGAIPEQLSGGGGLTCDPGDIAGFAAALARLSDPEIYATASAAARQRWESTYTQKAHIRALIAAWQEVAQRHYFPAGG